MAAKAAQAASQAANLSAPQLEAVYAMSRVVVETVAVDDALAKIVQLARPVFIFDNAVLYIYNAQSQTLEASFARAIGRGRSTEADLAWGEVAAQEAFESSQIYIREPELNPELDRLEQHFYLGLPLKVGGQLLGALVFVRFGGPTYGEEQLVLADYITTHVSQVLGRQQLIDRIANLEAERRLASLQSDFIATVSHELRTPLGFIKGYSSTLLRQDTEWDVDSRSEFLTIIDEEADRLSDLVDNLLDSSRLQAGTLNLELQHIDLAGLLEESIDRLQSRYPELAIRFESDLNELEIQADPRRLDQIVDNLVSNAAKYAPGSRVTIGLAKAEDWAHIEVTDTGSGIPAEHAENIFKRFYRIPENTEGVRGSGLGLYICEQIARAHHGSIQVDSTSSKGAHFVISLPFEQPLPLAEEREHA
jgi:signal transduction histidine kinase